MKLGRLRLVSMRAKKMEKVGDKTLLFQPSFTRDSRAKSTLWSFHDNYVLILRQNTGPSRCPKSLKCMGNTCRRSLSGQREIHPRNFHYGEYRTASINLSISLINFLALFYYLLISWSIMNVYVFYNLIILNSCIK